MSGEPANSSFSDRLMLSGKQTSDNRLDNQQVQPNSSILRLKTTKLFLKLSRKKLQQDTTTIKNSVTEEKLPILDDHDTIESYAPFSDNTTTNAEDVPANTNNRTSLFGNKASISFKKLTSSTIRMVDPTSPNSQLNNFFKSLSPALDHGLETNGYMQVQTQNLENITSHKDTNLPVAMTNGKSKSTSAMTNSSTPTIITGSIKEEDEECENIISSSDNSDDSVDEFQSVLEFPKLAQTNEVKSEYSLDNSKVSDKVLTPRIARSIESLKVKKKNSLPELKISNHFQSRTIFKNNNFNSSHSSNSSSRMSSPKTPTTSTTMSVQLLKIRKKLSVVANQQNSINNINGGISTLAESNDKGSIPIASSVFPIMRHTNSSSSSVKTSKSKSSASRTSTSSARSWEHRNFRTIPGGSCTVSPNNGTDRTRSNSLNNSNGNTSMNNFNSSPISPAKGFSKNRIRSNSLNSSISADTGSTSIINISNGRRVNSNNYSSKRISNNNMGSIASSRLSPRSSMFLFNNNNNNNNNKESNSRRSSHIFNSADELFNQNGLFLSYEGNSNLMSKPNSPTFDSNSRIANLNIFSPFSDQIESTQNKNSKNVNNSKRPSENNSRRRSKTLNSLMLSSSSFSSSHQTQMSSLLIQSTDALHYSSPQKRVNDNIDGINNTIGINDNGNRVPSFGLTSSRLKLNTNSSSLAIGASTFFEESKIRSRSGSFLFSPSFLRSSSHGNNNSNNNSNDFYLSSNGNDSIIAEKEAKYGLLISQVRQSLESKLLPVLKLKRKLQSPRPQDSILTYLIYLIEEGYSYEIVNILTSKIQIKKYLLKSNDVNINDSNNFNSSFHDEADAFKNFNDSQIENLMEFKFGNNHTAAAQSIFYKKCLYLYTFLYFIDLFFNTDGGSNAINDVFPSEESILDYRMPYMDLISLVSTNNGNKIFPMNNNRTKKIQNFFMTAASNNIEDNWLKLQQILITKFPLDIILRHFLFFNMLPKETEKIDLALQVLAYNYNYFINLLHLKSIWRFVENRPTYDDSNLSVQDLEKTKSNCDVQSDSDNSDDFQSTNEEFLDDTVIIHSPPNSEANKSLFNMRLSSSTSEKLTIINSTTDIYTLFFILLVLQTDHFNKSNKTKMSLKDFTSIIRNFQKEDKSKLTLLLFQFPEIIEYFYYNVTATPLKSLIEILCQIPYVESIIQAGLASISKENITISPAAQQHSSTRSNSFVSSLLSPTSPSFSSYVGGSKDNNCATNSGLNLSSNVSKRKSSFFSSSNASLNILNNQNLTIDPYKIHSSQDFLNYTVSNCHNNFWTAADISVCSNSGNLSFTALDVSSHEHFFEDCFSEEFFQLFLHSEISTTPPIILKVDNSFDIGASASSILAIPNNSKLEKCFKLGNEKIPMFTRIFQIGILLKKTGLSDSASLFFNHYDNYEKQQNFLDGYSPFSTNNSEFTYGNEQTFLPQTPPIAATQSMTQQSQPQSGYLSKKASILKMRAKVKMNFSTTNPSSSTTNASCANGHAANSSKANSMDDWTKCCAVLSSLGLSVFRNVNFELLEGYINGNEGKLAINILHSSMLLIGNGELESFIPAENLFAINLDADDSEFQVGWAQKISNNNPALSSELINQTNIYKENFKCPEGASSKWVNLINVIGAFSDLALDSRNKKITSLHVPGYPNIFELRTDRQVPVDFSYRAVHKEIQWINELLVELERVYNFAIRLIPFTSKCRSVIENLVMELLPLKKTFLIYRKSTLNARLFLLGKLRGSDGVNSERSTIVNNKKRDSENKEYHKFKDTCDILSVVFSDVILQTKNMETKHDPKVAFDDILPENI